MSSIFYNLPQHVQKIILQLILVLAPLPDRLNIPHYEKDALQRIDYLLSSFPPLYRWGLFVSLTLFHFTPFLFGFGLRTFTDMSLKDGLLYLQDWENSRILFRREYFRVLRILVMMNVFSDERLWPEIGYHPVAHMEEKMKVRQQIIEKNPKILVGLK